MKLVVIAVILVFFAQTVLAASDVTFSPATTVLSKEIPLTPGVDSALHMLFRLPAETSLSFQSAIILSVLFLVSFFVINSVISLIPFFEGTFSRTVGAIVITLLTALGGGMYETFALLTSFSNSLTSQSGMSNWGFLIVVAILMFVASVVWVVSKGIKKLLTKEEAAAAGNKLGRDIAESKLYGKMFKKTIR
jgi:hypothetical protein